MFDYDYILMFRLLVAGSQVNIADFEKAMLSDKFRHFLAAR